MKVGILVLMAGRTAGGPETYEVQLLRALARRDPNNEYVIYCTGPEAPKAIGIAQENFRFHVLKPSLRAVSVAMTLPMQLKRDRIDILHSTFTPPPVLDMPEVLTVHCLSSFVHPDFYSPLIRYRLNALLRIGVRRARCILCVSQTTAEDLHNRFQIPRDRIVVTYNGVAEKFSPVGTAEAVRVVHDEFGINGPYCLFLGKIEPRKNVIRMLEAFARFHNLSGSPTRLVIAGNRTAVTPAVEEVIRRLKLENTVIQLGYVPDHALTALYSAARMFLFPSIWEGFGIPVVEAMACGVPVVTSNATCLPEVVGDAAVIVDPNSTESIADGIALLDGSEELRSTLSRRGLARAKMYSWDSSAERTLQAYKRVLM